MGAAWLLLGGCAWLLPGGAVWLLRGACMVAQGGHAWLLWGVCVVSPGGACMVALGREGMRGCSGEGGHAWVAPGGHAWDMMTHRDTVNERAVRILRECILVNKWVWNTFCQCKFDWDRDGHLTVCVNVPQLLRLRQSHHQSLMECSHSPTQTPTSTSTKWVCNPSASVSVLVLVLVSVSLNRSAYYNWTRFLSLCQPVWTHPQNSIQPIF